MAADFDATADELYALPLERFIEQRDAAVRAAKRDDPAAAKAIQALKKPSTAAWLLNQLVRAKADEVSSLLDLGAALRQAQSRLEGAQLRDLSTQRRQAVNALVREARHLAARLLKPASESVAREVEQSLEAALASPDAARLVESGRLTTALTPDTGFDSAAPHLRVVHTEKAQPGRRAAKATADKKAAEEALKRAQTAAAQAASELDAVTAKRDAAAGRVENLTAEIADLTRRLAGLEQELAAVKRAEREARNEANAAERAARKANLSVEQAKAASTSQ